MQFKKKASIVMLINLYIFAAMIAGTLSTSTRTVFIQENSPSDTFVADVSKYFENSGRNQIGKRFVLLNQKLIGRKRHYSNRRQSWFALDGETGILTVKKKLDREKMCQKSHQCTVYLQIFSKYSSAMVDLKVEITDENEFPPVFPVTLIILNISEAARVGDVINIDNCRAEDDDFGYNSTISYTLTKSKYFGLKQFIDETSSPRLQVELLAKLDYEEKSFHRLILTASDSGTPSLSSQIPLQIQVIDENDNSPKFQKQEYFLALKENAGSGQVIKRIQAHDEDSGASGTINYFLSGPNRDETSTLVEINKETGDITLKQDLDREAVAEIVVFIEARDLGTPQLIGRTRLVIYVSDVNDNSPMVAITFLYPSKDNTVYLSESMKKHEYFAYISVKDYDLESNGQVHVSVKTTATRGHGQLGDNSDISEIFRLTKDGFLGLNTELDRETQSRYRIIINATDRGTRPRWTTEEMRVVVLDENDNAPQFSQQIYNVSVFENAKVGNQLIKILATDADATNPTALALREDGSIVASTNGAVTYSLDSKAAGIFSIDSRTGDLTLASPLDREQISTWIITVTATDNGYPSSKQSTCRLLILVNDTNDNSPVFTNPLKDDATVYATILRDDVITKIQASDYDEGDNKLVRYFLLSVDRLPHMNNANSSLFILDSSSGDLRLNMSNQNLSKSLGHHVAIIQARDFGFPPLKTNRKLNIIITDDLVLPSNSITLKSGENGMNKSHVNIIVIVVSIGIGILLAIFVVAFLKCRRNRMQNRNKTQVPGENCRMLQNSIKKSQYSANISRTDSISDIANQKCLDREIEPMTYDASFTDVTHLSRSDVMLQHNFQQHLNPRSMVASREGSFKRSQVSADKNILSPNNGNGQDADSGRGDSDPGVGSPFEQDCSRRASFGPNCSNQCIHYGHSDHCWMPQNKGLQPNSPGITSEHKLLHSTVLQNKRHSYSCKNYVESIPPQLTPVFYPSPVSGNINLTPIYSQTLPHVLVTTATWAENLNLEVDERLSSNCKKTSCSDAIASSRHVTESEVV